MKRWLPYLALVAIVVGVANFAWFFAESAANGDALNGFVRDGHYYLNSHGRLTEVTQVAWEWSRFHAESVFATHLLAMAGMAYLLVAFVFPSMISSAAGTPSPGRRQLVRGSGPVVARGRTSGRLGELWLSGPLIDVAAYPAGLVLKPFLMRDRTILWSEIHEVDHQRGLFKRGTWIEHDGVEVASPILLRLAPNGLVLKAIERLAAHGRETSGGARPPAASSPTRARPGFWSTIASTSALPRRDSAPRGIIASLEILGIAVGIALFVAGLLWAIPTFGPFGWFWTAAVGGITVFNAFRIVRSR